MSEAQSATPTVLVINAGSSSLKFQLVAPSTGDVLASGIVERIGLDEGSAKITAGGREASEQAPVPDHVAAMRMVETLFADVDLSLADAGIRAVGHRVVQGGSVFSEPTVVDASVRERIHELGALAPLHNYANLHGIDGARELLPEVPHVAVFDTAFFTSLPASASTYALNRDVAEEHGIRRYGAHGTSHRFVSEAVPEFLGRDPQDFRQVVLHLGNGASASAVRDGSPVDTSMGLTPLEGLVMGTRTGDIDPSVYVHLHRQAGMAPEDVDTLLNKKSGMQGLCGMSDFRDIEEAIESGSEGAEAAGLAMDVYTHRLRKYLGAYAFVLGRLDAITFTAGIGENSPVVRGRVLQDLEAFGIRIDPAKNDPRSKEPRVISADDSAVTVVVYPTNEELAIAQQASAAADES